MKLCSICKKEIDSDTAPILTMGGFGNPKYLCDSCAENMDTVTASHDPEQIEGAMKQIAAKISSAQVDDKLVMDTVGEIFSEAGKRAALIREGNYDFSLDSKDEGLEDIPQELLESEEDKLLDEKDAETNKKIDKILNWITAGFIVAAVGILISYFLF